MQIVFTKYKVINGRHGVYFFKRLLFATFSDSKERRPLGGLNCNLEKVSEKKEHFKVFAYFALVSTREIQY